MNTVVLPDCFATTHRLRLTGRQRRDLVRILAEEGPDGIEAWLRRESSQDPDLRARVAAEREALEREAQAQRRRLETLHAQEDAQAETAWERAMRARMERDEALQAELAELAGRPLLTRDALLASSPLHQAVLDPPRPGLLRRALARLRRLWLVIVSWWVRFVRRLRGEEMAAPRHIVTLPDGAAFDLSGVGPDALLALRRHAPGRRERMREAWDRLLGRADYAEHVADLMRREVERLEAAESERRQAEQERLERELAAAHGEDEEDEAARAAASRAREEAHRKALEDLARRAEAEPLEHIRQEILEDFADAGLVDASGAATHNLVQRFATGLYEEVRRGLPGHGQARPGTYVEGDGALETGPLRSQHEIGAMDLVGSVVRARLRHPGQRHIYDDDIIVHREVRMARAHVVVVFDTSGSMEVEGRLDAAKRVCLVLHRAVKERDPTHRVDLLRMHTSIERVDLAGCWNSQPMGFTNHGAAMREARRLFAAEGAEQKLLYLVTDGLPEAYTKPDGTDRADRPDVCMQDARREARRLREVPGLATTIIQLETRDERFVDAARELAEAAGARVEALDPQELVEWMLGDYDVQTVQDR